MKHIEERNLFETSDLALVSALCCLGCRIEAIDKTKPSRAVFIMERSRDLDELIQAFWSRSLQVEPLTYFNSLKDIKTRLYQTLE